MHDDAAPVAPRRPEKETHVPKGKKRTDGPSFCRIQSSAATAAPHRLLLFAPLLPWPPLSPFRSRSCYRYIRRSDRQISLPPAVAALLPSPSFLLRVSNDSLGGGNEILILRDDDVDV